VTQIDSIALLGAADAPISNSFGIATKAKRVFELNAVEQLLGLAKATSIEKHLILGGASNILFTQDFDGLVVRNELKGLHVEPLQAGKHKVTCGAGENWADFVDTMTAKGLFGLENLSLIPGSVGASPVQNIGAYGIEMRQCFSELKAFDLTTGRTQTFDTQDCAFAYRDSIFKRPDMRQWLITEVSFILDEKAIIELGYGDLKTEALKLAAHRGQTQPTHSEVAQAVKSIRRSKLPDPAVIGNAGSFFKNPKVSNAKLNDLRTNHPTLPAYPLADDVNQQKIPAGWLIDKAGWKGFRRGDAGVHKDHALVLVNYGSATGQEVWQLARDIQASVNDKFGVLIEPEPIVI
jgi:UDP-N-acetylmuramate dehydrogenase